MTQVHGNTTRAENVARAERVMKALVSGNGSVTTTKLRSMFALLTDLYNEVVISGEERMTTDQVNQLLSAKVRIIYEIGREERQEIANFVQQSGLLSEIDAAASAGTCSALIEFYHYFEALVAYQRYYMTILGKRGN